MSIKKLYCPPTPGLGGLNLAYVICAQSKKKMEGRFFTVCTDISKTRIVSKEDHIDVEIRRQSSWKPFKKIYWNEILFFHKAQQSFIFCLYVVKAQWKKRLIGIRNCLEFDKTFNMGFHCQKKKFTSTRNFSFHRHGRDTDTWNSLKVGKTVQCNDSISVFFQLLCFQWTNHYTTGSASTRTKKRCINHTKNWT